LHYLLLFFVENKNMLDYWERVTKIIDSQNIKQSWIAEKTGILHQTLSQWILKDRLPNVEDGQKIATILGVTVEYLVTGKPPAGLSEDVLAIARAAERLSPEGRKVALHQVEALAADFPCESSGLSNRV
jgi:transcriptional regulator with XRE-family HTH domain